MTLKQYLFEGAAAGTTATTTLTGASVVNQAPPGTITFTAAAAAHGSCGLEFVTNATGQYTIARFTANAANDQMAFSGVFAYVGTGTGGAPVGATAVLGALQPLGTNTNLIQFRVSTANAMVVSDSANVAIGAATPTLVPGTKYRIEVVANRTTGAVTANLYPTTGTTTTAIATWSKASGASVGATAFGQAELGVLSSNQAMTVRWDDVQFNDGSTSEIGAFTASSSPLAGSGTLTPTSGTYPLTVTSTLTATGGTGTGRQFTWTWGDGQTTGPQPSGTATHTYAAAGSYSPSATVTEP